MRFVLEFVGNQFFIVNDGLIGLFVDLGLRRRRDFELRNVVLVLLDVVVSTEEGIWLGVNCWQDVECIVVGYADVVIKNIETIIAVLSDPCFPLFLLDLVLVDGFLDELVDVGVELDIDFFGLNDWSNGISRFILFLSVVLHSL